MSIPEENECNLRLLRLNLSVTYRSLKLISLLINYGTIFFSSDKSASARKPSDKQILTLTGFKNNCNNKITYPFVPLHNRRAHGNAPTYRTRPKLKTGERFQFPSLHRSPLNIPFHSTAHRRAPEPRQGRRRPPHPNPNGRARSSQRRRAR